MRDSLTCAIFPQTPSASFHSLTRHTNYATEAAMRDRKRPYHITRTTLSMHFQPAFCLRANQKRLH